MTGVLLIVLTGFLWCGCGIIYSIFARRQLNFVVIMAIGETLMFLIACVGIAKWQIVLHQPIPRIQEMVIILVASGICGGLGFWLQQLAMQQGHHGIVWTISQSAMIIPFLAGLIIFREPLTDVQLAGMAIVVLSFLVLGWNMNKQEKSEKGGLKWFALALASFLVLGFCQTFSSVPSYWDDWSDIANLRTPLFFLGYCLPFVLPALWQRQRPTWLDVKMALLLTVVGLSAQHCFFMAIDQLEKVNMVSLAFPLAIGVCILSFLLYSVFFLKEKNSWRGWIGFSLTLTGMLILAF